MVTAYHLDNFHRGLTGASGQAAHLVGDHGKAAALFTGTRGLDGGVERQQVGLLGDAADGLHDAADHFRLLADGTDAFGGAVQLAGDALHDLDGVLHHLGTLLGGGIGLQGGVVGNACGAAFGFLMLHLLGDVTGKLDHFVQFSVAVEYRVVGGA